MASDLFASLGLGTNPFSPARSGVSSANAKNPFPSASTPTGQNATATGSPVKANQKNTQKNEVGSINIGSNPSPASPSWVVWLLVGLGAIALIILFFLIL